MLTVDELKRRLQSLSLAANEHAREQYGLAIAATDPGAIELVDRILDDQRSAGQRNLIEALTLCYGAWWGEYVIERFGGDWVGLHEPTPPRVVLGGVVYSPFDAVRRRLSQASSSSLRLLAEDLDRSRANFVSNFIETNRLAWNHKTDDPRFTHSGQTPASREEALERVDPWLREEGSLETRRVLCLAAGGGTHGPLHAMAGAVVTVVDLSPQQLLLDQQVADQLGLSLKLIATSMHDLTMIEDASFDAIVHPVSLCYIQDVSAVYREIGRVLKPGGIYISQQKQSASLQASSFKPGTGYVLMHPCDEACRLLPSTEETWFRETGTTEFVHTLETLLGGLCRSGFVVEDVREPPRGDAWSSPGSAEHRARYLPPYLKIKARRKDDRGR